MRVASRAGHRQVMPVEIISDKIGCQCGAVENRLHKRLRLSFVADTPTDRTRVEESFLRVRASPKRPVTLVIGCHPRIIAAIRIFRIQNVDIRMLNSIAREYAIGRRRCPNRISLNRTSRPLLFYSPKPGCLRSSQHSGRELSEPQSECRSEFQ